MQGDRSNDFRQVDQENEKEDGITSTDEEQAIYATPPNNTRFKNPNDQKGHESNDTNRSNIIDSDNRLTIEAKQPENVYENKPEGPSSVENYMDMNIRDSNETTNENRDDSIEYQNTDN